MRNENCSCPTEVWHNELCPTCIRSMYHDDGYTPADGWFTAEQLADALTEVMA